MGSFCYKCMNFKKTKSKNGIGKCIKYGSQVIDTLNGCIDGEKKSK